VTAEKARRAYEADLRSAWERAYTGAIKAAQSGDAARLVDLLRAERVPTSNDFQRLGDYVERVHRKPGRTDDTTVHNNALVAEALFDHFRLATGRTDVPDKVRQRVYYYVCGIKPEKVDYPERLNDRDAEKLGAVEKLSERIRKGRHVPKGRGHKEQRKPSHKSEI
jgi:hypothetical protein